MTGRAAICRVFTGALLVAVALAPRSSAAAGTSLRRCLELAERNHPKLAEARAKVAQVRAQLQEAYYTPFSQFRLQGGFGLAPTLRGSAVFSPNTDASLTSSLGMAWQAGINGVVPLWTFGKLDNLWDAARHNVDLNEGQADMARDAVRFDVRQAYLGLQLARDGLHLLDNAQGQIDKAVDNLKQQVEEDEADPIDLLKLQTFVAELEVRRAEGEKFERVALSGLRYYTGVKDLEIVDTPLQKAPHRLMRLSRYLAAARVYRPEVRMAQAGVAARRAQLKLSRSRLYPDIGLALSVGFRSAPLIDDQINPFSNDPANFSGFGFGIVFNWDLDFLPDMARIQFAEAQLNEVLALDRQALGGVAAEVEGAYAEVVEAQKKLAAYEKAANYASEWLATVRQAIDIGTIEEKELIEPARVWATNRYNVLDQTMKYNMALAKLAQKTGWDAIAPGL